MTASGIEWTDSTWNPVVGCSHVSAGCAHCYAERVDHRLRGIAGEEWKAWTAPNAAYNVRLHPERLEAPLHWRKPRRVFVNSMSDLFHEQVPDEFIDRIFAVMALSPQHTFQVLTKRPDRMLAYLHGGRHERVNDALSAIGHAHCRRSPAYGDWPLPNVWLGVSAEDQATADARIPELLATPAAVRFVSYEPALGPVDFTNLNHEAYHRAALTRLLKGKDDEALADILASMGGDAEPFSLNALTGERFDGEDVTDGSKLSWIIVGGESGPGARPFDIGWARDTIAQCRAAGVACFVKQLGAKPVGPKDWAQGGWSSGSADDGSYERRLKDSHGGEMAEWPEDLRVREFPGGAP